MSGIECENTNSAFIVAGNRSYFGIETDVHITADGKFVVIHDDNTARVSDIDIAVEKSALAELCPIIEPGFGFAENIKLDPSRVASNIASGIGFLGQV